MNMKLGFKILAMLGITLLISISLIMVRSLINERSNRAQEVKNSLADKTAGPQIISGPYLVIPYIIEESFTQPANNANTDRKEYVLLLSPEQINNKSDLQLEIKKRGLFEAPTFKSNSVMTGYFRPNKELLALKKLPANQKIIWQKAYLSLGLQDPKGIRQITATMGNSVLEFEPGHSINNWSKTSPGIHANLTEGAEFFQQILSQDQDFKINLDLVGSQSFLLDLAGTSSKIDITGNWPHPSYKGISPDSDSLSKLSFAASWKTNSLAKGISIQTCKTEDSNCTEIKPASSLVGLDLIDPVNRYVLSDRTAKYGELFLILTFAILFLMEVLRKNPIHPMQYALVGFATSVFFLLTLSLSEHISFYRAYGIAASASVALQGFYASAVLQSKKLALIFSSSLMALYGLLFFILRSEDSALMVGSLLVFAMLAGFMMLTRNVNWYALSQSEKKADTQPSNIYL